MNQNQNTNFRNNYLSENYNECNEIQSYSSQNNQSNQSLFTHNNNIILSNAPNQLLTNSQSYHHNNNNININSNNNNSNHNVFLPNSPNSLFTHSQSYQYNNNSNNLILTQNNNPNHLLFTNSESYNNNNTSLFNESNVSNNLQINNENLLYKSIEDILGPNIKDCIVFLKHNTLPTVCIKSKLKSHNLKNFYNEYKNLFPKEENFYFSKIDKTTIKKLNGNYNKSCINRKMVVCSPLFYSIASIKYEIATEYFSKENLFKKIIMEDNNLDCLLLTKEYKEFYRSLIIDSLNIQNIHNNDENTILFNENQKLVYDKINELLNTLDGLDKEKLLEILFLSNPLPSIFNDLSEKIKENNTNNEKKVKKYVYEIYQTKDIKQLSYILKLFRLPSDILTALKSIYPSFPSKHFYFQYSNFLKSNLDKIINFKVEINKGSSIENLKFFLELLANQFSLLELDINNRNQILTYYFHLHWDFAPGEGKLKENTTLEIQICIPGYSMKVKISTLIVGVYQGKELTCKEQVIESAKNALSIKKINVINSKGEQVEANCVIFCCVDMSAEHSMSEPKEFLAILYPRDNKNYLCCIPMDINQKEYYQKNCNEFDVQNTNNPFVKKIFDNSCEIDTMGYSLQKNSYKFLKANKFNFNSNFTCSFGSCPLNCEANGNFYNPYYVKFLYLYFFIDV